MGEYEIQEGLRLKTLDMLGDDEWPPGSQPHAAFNSPLPFHISHSTANESVEVCSQHSGPFDFLSPA